jgi:hypothetical protein
LNDEMWSLNATVAATLRFAIPGLLMGPSCWFVQPASLHDSIRYRGNYDFSGNTCM